MPKDDNLANSGPEHDHSDGGDDALVVPPTPTGNNVIETPIAAAGAVIFGINNVVYMMGAAIAGGIAAL